MPATPKTPPIDIRPDHWAIVRDILQRHVPQREVWAFGSRAKWTAKEYSDLDLAVIGDEPLGLSASAALADAFSESDLPWKVDVVDWATTSETFRKIIERDKVVVQKATAVRLAPGEWPLIRLGDYVDSNLGKMLDAQKNKGRLQPYLGNSNVRWGTFDLTDLAQMRFEEHEEDRYGIRSGDLIVCEGGEPGRSAVWREEVPNMKIQKALHRIRTKIGLNNYYLFYWFMLAARTGRLEPYFTGTTIKHLTGKALSALELPLPPIEVQEEIARILKSLDDKIDLNHRMNETLEAMARAIFKSWFVDFDPVRAKASGEPPETICRRLRLTPDLLALFPDRLVDSELGEIPEGWSVAPLPQVFDVNPTRSLRKGASAPYLDMANMPTSAARALSHIQRDFGSGTKFINGDTLVARITPCLENGKTCFVDFLEENQVGWGSTEYIVFRPKQPLPNEYAYFLTRTETFRNHAIANMTGTSGRQRVPASAFGGFRVVVPSVEVASEFGRFAAAAIAKMRGNDEESRSLASIRDTLLPKLLSGELLVATHGIAEGQMAS